MSVDEAEAAAIQAGLKPPGTVAVTKIGKEGRLRFEHQGE